MPEQDNPIKVLIIDDDPMICEVIKKGLQVLGGYKVLTASGGNIGGWLAACKWHRPDIVLLDIMMKGIDGFEVLRKLREEKTTAYIPVIMLTGRGDVSSKIKAEGLYCDDYLVKPVELKVIKEKIEEILTKRGRIPGKNEEKSDNGPVNTAD